MGAAWASLFLFNAFAGVTICLLQPTAKASNAASATCEIQMGDLITLLAVGENCDTVNCCKLRTRRELLKTKEVVRVAGCNFFRRSSGPRENHLQ